jgi:hypothetical protein
MDLVLPVVDTKVHPHGKVETCKHHRLTPGSLFCVNELAPRDSTKVFSHLEIAWCDGQGFLMLPKTNHGASGKDAPKANEHNQADGDRTRSAWISFDHEQLRRGVVGV